MQWFDVLLKNVYFTQCHARLLAVENMILGLMPAQTATFFRSVMQCP